jgi:hypothetical protein
LGFSRSTAATVPAKVEYAPQGEPCIDRSPDHKSPSKDGEIVFAIDLEPTRADGAAPRAHDLRGEKALIEAAASDTWRVDSGA